MNVRKKVFLILSIACCLHSRGQELRWRPARDGEIIWTFKKGDIHTDHIEMSGRRLSAIVTYGSDALQGLVLSRQLIFPMLRTRPNDTHASLKEVFNENIIDSITVNGRRLKEKPVRFAINGFLRTESVTDAGVSVERRVYPSVG